MTFYTCNETGLAKSFLLRYMFTLYPDESIQPMTTQSEHTLSLWILFSTALVSLETNLWHRSPSQTDSLGPGCANLNMVTKTS